MYSTSQLCNWEKFSYHAVVPNIRSEQVRCNNVRKANNAGKVTFRAVSVKHGSKICTSAPDIT